MRRFLIACICAAFLLTATGGFSRESVSASPNPGRAVPTLNVFDPAALSEELSDRYESDVIDAVHAGEVNLIHVSKSLFHHTGKHDHLEEKDDSEETDAEEREE